MLLKAVQECTLEAVTLIAQGKLSRASDLLVCLIRSLQERELELQLNPPLRPTHQTLQVQDLVFLPVSKECRVSAPEWDEEIFDLPFAFFSPLGVDLTDQVVTESIATALSGVCLFMLGLCYHRHAQDNQQHKQTCSGKTLRTACTFYQHAWHSLQKAFRLEEGALQSTSFLLMAIATNMIHSTASVGEIEAANAWIATLKESTQRLWLKEDNLTLQLHNYFLIASTVNTGFVAAGAA